MANKYRLLLSPSDASVLSFPLAISGEGETKGTTHATGCCRCATHFEVFGTLTMGSGSEALSGSAEIACLVGRPLTADATGARYPSPPYTGRSSADMRMDMMCWVRGRTTCWNLSISLRKCRTLASRSSSRHSSRTMYSSFFRDSATQWASSRSRSRSLFITDMLMAYGAAPRPSKNTRDRYGHSGARDKSRSVSPGGCGRDRKKRRAG